MGLLLVKAGLQNCRQCTRGVDFPAADQIPVGLNPIGRLNCNAAPLACRLLPLQLLFFRLRELAALLCKKVCSARLQEVKISSILAAFPEHDAHYC